MQRRRFLLSVGAAASLAGCTGEQPSDEGEPNATGTNGTNGSTTTDPAGTNEPNSSSATDPTGDDLLAYLFTADGLGGNWSQTVERSGSNFAERGFENGATGRRLAVGVRVEDTVSAAEDSVAGQRSRFEGGAEIDRAIGDETYESYPEEFDTGVMFRVGRYLGFVALAENDPTLDRAVARGEELRSRLP